jgi:hypothetical protein
MMPCAMSTTLMIGVNKTTTRATVVTGKASAGSKKSCRNTL